MEKAVEESLQAASVYVRYRDTEWEKAGLLYTYLMERFTYTERETAHAALFRPLRGPHHEPERRDRVEAALRPDRH